MSTKTERLTPEIVAQMVRKLVGPINPLADASRDPERLENLKMLCDVVGYLVEDIYLVAQDNRDRHEGTVRTAQKCAESFIRDQKFMCDTYNPDHEQDDNRV